MATPPSTAGTAANPGTGLPATLAIIRALTNVPYKEPNQFKLSLALAKLRLISISLCIIAFRIIFSSIDLSIEATEYFVPISEGRCCWILLFKSIAIVKKVEEERMNE